MSIQIVLMLLGAALGFAVYNPTSSEHPFAEFGTGAAIIQGLTAVLSLWVGGWIAGRFLRQGSEALGGLHGFMVWSFSTVVAVVLLTTGTGWFLGAMGRTVATGLSVAGQTAVTGAGESNALAKIAAENNVTLADSFLREAQATPVVGKAPSEVVKGTRDLHFAIAHFLTSDENGQAHLIPSLMEAQGLTEPDAKKMVAGWQKSIDQRKADVDAALKVAEEKARLAADETAHTLSILSCCYFLGFVLGGCFAMVGGKHGATCACCRRDIAMRVG